MTAILHCAAHEPRSINYIEQMLANQQSFMLVLPACSDGLNTMRAERKTTQVREERLREQLDAKEKQLADMEVGAGRALYCQSRAVL